MYNIIFIALYIIITFIGKWLFTLCCTTTQTINYDNLEICIIMIPHKLCIGLINDKIFQEIQVSSSDMQMFRQDHYVHRLRAQAHAKNVCE